MFTKDTSGMLGRGALLVTFGAICHQYATISSLGYRAYLIINLNSSFWRFKSTGLFVPLLDIGMTANIINQHGVQLTRFGSNVGFRLMLGSGEIRVGYGLYVNHMEDTDLSGDRIPLTLPST